MLGAEAGRRFADVLVDVVTETAMSYPLILHGKEVFFTYDILGDGEKRNICPREIFSRNLQNDEIMRIDFEKKFTQEEIDDCLKKGMCFSKLRGLEAMKAEEELLDCYEQIWQNYYEAENPDDLFLQQRWKELFMDLIPDSSLRRLYLLIGKEMLEKETK